MSKNVNACCSGDMMVMTAYGAKSFRDLANEGKDVPVYCLGDNGEYTISMMVHPRISGYDMEVYRVKLENGIEIDVTPEHMLLTDFGYVEVHDFIKGEDGVFVFELKSEDELLCDDILCNYNERYKNITKKGTLLKSCEYCGNMFETMWDEREVCCCEEHHFQLFNKIKESHRDVVNKCKCNCVVSNIVSIEYIGRMDVYNGTVEQYHNYFIIDKKTNLMVNQVNCGETYIK